MTSKADDNDLLKQGRRLLRANDAASAAACFRQAIAADPDNAVAHEGLGTACFLAGDLDEAAAAFTTVTRLKPKEARGFINLGAVFNRQRHYQKALDTLRRALVSDRTSADAFYNMGLAHRGLKQFPLAVTAYREAIRLSPDMAEAHLNLANTYFEMKNYVPAKKEYEKAIELRPGFERAVRGLNQTQQVLDDQQRKTSPFGRLVEPTATPSAADAAVNAMRSLSDEDRLKQRQQIQQIAEVSETTARGLADQLYQQLIRAIFTLNKTVTQPGNPKFVIQDALEEFRTTVNQIMPLSQMLREQTDELERLITPANN